MEVVTSSDVKDERSALEEDPDSKALLYPSGRVIVVKEETTDVFDASKGEDTKRGKGFCWNGQRLIRC